MGNSKTKIIRRKWKITIENIKWKKRMGNLKTKIIRRNERIKLKKKNVKN